MNRHINPITRCATLVLIALCGACSLPATRHSAGKALPPLSLHSDSPQSQAPRAHIIGLHSFGDNYQAFDQWVAWGVERNIAVHRFDQLGFGQRGELGRWYGAEAMVEDAIASARRIKNNSSAPIYLMGESMGGSVAIIAAAQQPQLFDGLILAAPAVREGIFIRYPYNAALNVVSGLAPSASASIERDPSNPALIARTAERLAHSPYTLREVRMDTYRGLIRLADIASNRAEQVQMPVLLFYGGQDESVPKVAIKSVNQHWQNNVEYHYREAWPHLIFQSEEWRSVADIMQAWLENNKRRQSS